MSAPATPPPGRKRKSRGLRVELRAALRFCGIDPDRPFEWQHSPPLGIRPFDPIADDYDPPENDDRYIIPMQKAAHAKVTKEVDRPAIDKTRRRASAQAKHVAAMTGIPMAEDIKTPDGHALQPGRSNWPKGRKLRSRGFPKR